MKKRTTAGLTAPLLAACAAAMLLAPHTVLAQASSLSQIPYGLAGSPAWRENITQGVDLWVFANDAARRTLLLHKCTALDRNFPRKPAPAMVAASTEVFRWMTGEAHADLPPDPYFKAKGQFLPVVAKHAFSAKELADWEALRASPQGQRGLAAYEIELALMKVSDQLVDVVTGIHWGWPLARLVRLADAHGFAREFDATFEEAAPGTAARLRAISLVPGETPVDERFLERVSQVGEPLAQAFIQRLAPADKDAYERVVRMNMLPRWAAVSQTLDQFARRREETVLRNYMLGQDVPATVPELCEKLGLSSCQPGGELHAAITGYRSAMQGASDGASMNAARQIVRGLPASGCP